MNWNHKNRIEHPLFFLSLVASLLFGVFFLARTDVLAQEQDTSKPATAPSNPINPSPVVAPAPVLPEPAPVSNNPSSSSAASLESMDQLDDKVKLSNGDRVSYRVIEEQKDPCLLTISDTGELEIPLVGRIKAAGKSCKQVANELKPLLEKDYFYHATVIVGVETLSLHPQGKVYLTGQVRTQGAIEIPPNETLTVSRAILLDGGLADFADRRKVKLVRKKPDGTTDTTIVDMVEILDHGHTDRDPVLQAGDLIIVPQRLFNY